MNKIYSQQIEAYMWSNTSLIHQHYNASHWLIAKIRSCILFQIIDLPCRLLVRLLCAFTKVIDNWSYNAPFCLNFAWPTPCLTCNILRYISIRLIISAWEGWEKCWSCFSLWLFVPLAEETDEEKKKINNRQTSHFSHLPARGSDCSNSGNYKVKPKHCITRNRTDCTH